MIIAKLAKSTGEVIELNIPETGSEMKLSQALDFNVGCLRLFEWIRDHAETIDSHRVEYLVNIINVINTYYDGLVDFFEIESDVIDQITIADINANLEHLVNGIDVPKATGTALGIFNLLLAATRNTTPQIEDGWPQTFEYKGKVFCFPEIWKDKLYNSLNYKSISVKQAIEILQVHNNYITNVKDLQRTDENHVNMTFTKYLSELAILLLQKDETIPTDETEFKQFMAERMDFWQDIDLQTAVNVEAWFENYYEWLKADAENHYYFNSKEPSSKEEVEAMRKASAHNKEVHEKIGSKSIISRLVEIGLFNGRAKTNIESAYTAPFTDAVKAISIENSKQ